MCIRDRRDLQFFPVRERVDRKNRSVAARLRNAETCADGLVDALRARRLAAPRPARGAEAQFSSLFRVANTARDALLYDCGAVDATSVCEDGSGPPRAGRLYVASSGVFFHSPGLAGFGARQIVLPYYALKPPEVVDGPLPGGGLAAVATKLAAALVRATDGRLGRLRFVDESGRATAFLVPPSPLDADHARQIAGLAARAAALDAAARAARAVSAAPSSPRGPASEAEILARVRRLSELSARNSRLLRAVADEPPPPATPLVVAERSTFGGIVAGEHSKLDRKSSKHGRKLAAQQSERDGKAAYQAAFDGTGRRAVHVRRHRRGRALQARRHRRGQALQ